MLRSLPEAKILVSGHFGKKVASLGAKSKLKVRSVATLEFSILMLLVGNKRMCEY